jgi:F0F1-type ATP synthase epsilon subunit
MADIDPKQAIDIEIVSPDTVIYKGMVKSLTSKNVRGLFDVLYLHTNFVSIVQEFVKVRELSGEEKKIPIKNGILKVFQNKVWIFTGIDES